MLGSRRVLGADTDNINPQGSDKPASSSPSEPCYGSRTNHEPLGKGVLMAWVSVVPRWKRGSCEPEKWPSHKTQMGCSILSYTRSKLNKMAYMHAYARGDDKWRVTKPARLLAIVGTVSWGGASAKRRKKMGALAELIRSEHDWIPSGHIEVLGTMIGCELYDYLFECVENYNRGRDWDPVRVLISNKKM